MWDQPGISDFQQEVKSDAEKIRELAATGKALEYAARKHPEDGEGIVSEAEAKPGSDLWNRIYNDYKWIIPFFETWYDIPDPKHTETIVDQLGRVVGEKGLKDDPDAVATLEPSGNLLGKPALTSAEAVVISVLKDWDGLAAETFQLMMRNLEPALRNQIALGMILRQMAIANHHIVSAVRRDVRKLQKDTITALEASIEHAGFDWGSIKLSLTIAGTAFAFASGVGAVPAIAGVATVWATPDGESGETDDERRAREQRGERRYNTTKAGMSLFSAAVGMGTYLPAEKKAQDKGGPLGAALVDDILTNMADGLNKIAADMTEAERAIVKVCDANVELINSSDKNGSTGKVNEAIPVVVAPRPAYLVNNPRTAYKRFRPEGTKFRKRS